MQPLLSGKAEKTDLSVLTSTLANKADKGDLDYFGSSLSNVKTEHDHKLLSLEKKLETTRGELESTKQLLNSSVTKKADAKDLDRLVQLVGKKADTDYTEDVLLQLRHEMADQIEYLKGEVQQHKRSFDENVTERVERSETFYEKISEDVYRLNDQLKGVLEATRNDIEQTRGVVKDLSSTMRKEINASSEKVHDEVQNIRKEINEIYGKKLDKKEWNEARTKLLAQLDGKVDLLEVQDALNTCQSDLSSRFIEYKDEIKNLIRNHDSDIYGLLSKKANISDINSILANKADTNTVNAQIAQKAGVQEIDDLKRKLDVIVRSNTEKAFVRGKSFVTL